jgi:Fic family protein
MPSAFFPYSVEPAWELCQELDAWAERLDRQGPLPRRWSGRMRRDLEAEAVAASLNIEQVPVTVDEVRRILVGEHPPTVSREDESLVRGYRDAMEFVLRRADDPGFQWEREMVVGLHDRVLAGNYAAGAGRFATGPRWVVDTTTGEELFVPAPWNSIPALVDRACAEIGRSTSHPAVQAAWIHAVTAAIHPFRDGNGRVARVLASLAMYRGGFKRREFTSLEEWWGRRRAEYYGAFACLGSQFDSNVDVTPFVETHVRAQVSQVRSLDLRRRVERRVWAALEEIVEDTHMPPRVVNALWDAFFERTVTAGYYMPIAEISRATATSDFASAVAAGLLEPHGERRGRRYLPAQALYERVGGLLGIEVPEHDARARLVAVLTRELADDAAPG